MKSDCPSVSIQNGLSNPIANLVRDVTIEESEEWSRSRERQLLDRKEPHREIETLLGDLGQAVEFPWAFVFHQLIGGGQHRDVLGRRRGQPPRHDLPMPVQKHERQDRLQDDDGRDDDDKGPRIEPLWRPDPK